MKLAAKILYLSLITSLLIGSYSCDKEKLQPVAAFSDQAGYQSNDTILAVGDTIKVMLDLTWNGKHRIKEIVLKMNDQVAGQYQVDIDEGQFSVTIIKGLPELETWDFKITDEGGNIKVISLKLTRDPNSRLSGVKYFDSIVLGAQNHPNKPGFLSIEESLYYHLDAAVNNQAKVDLIFYYDDADMATLASPGANIGDGIFAADKAPVTWDVKNTCRFQKVDMLPEIFFGIYHDGYILDNYDEDAAKRKAKNLSAGDVYLIQIENGKKGILYINSVTDGADGEVNFALKIQE